MMNKKTVFLQLTWAVSYQHHHTPSVDCYLREAVALLIYLQFRKPLVRQPSAFEWKLANSPSWTEIHQDERWRSTSEVFCKEEGWGIWNILILVSFVTLDTHTHTQPIYVWGGKLKLYFVGSSPVVLWQQKLPVHFSAKPPFLQEGDPYPSVSCSQL